jgi:hypothetical protein
MDPLVQPDGTAGLYVESDPREAIVDEIGKTLELKPDRRLLVVGCTGAGKTTLVSRSVQRMREAVKETGDYGVYLDVSRFHRLDAEPLEGVLIALAGEHLVNKARRKLGTAAEKNALFVAAAEAISKHARGYTEWVDEPDHYDENDEPPDDWEPGYQQPYPVRHDGVLKTPEEPMRPGRYAELVEPLKGLHALAVGDRAHTILAFDSLDRLSDATRFRDAVRHDLPVLAAAGIGTIVVGPVRYSLGFDRSVHDLFDGVQVVPSVDTENDRARDFLREVLRARDVQGMLPDGARGRLVEASGGILRDLVSLAQRSGEEAYSRGHDTVDDDDVGMAVSALGDALAFGIDDAALRVLRTLEEKNQFVIRGETELSLVDQRRVVNLRTGTWRIHPALLPKLHAIPREAA